MDQQALLWIMASFVAVAAVALVAQFCVMFGIYKAARSMQETTARLTPKVESLVEVSRSALLDSRTEIANITAKTNEILDTARTQLAVVDDVLGDAAQRARNQMDRAEMVLDDTMDRAQQTVAVLHGGIMKPLREINGVAVGLRAAVQYFMRGGRPSPDQATSDEEMFI